MCIFFGKWGGEEVGVDSQRSPLCASLLIWKPFIILTDSHILCLINSSPKQWWGLSQAVIQVPFLEKSVWKLTSSKYLYVSPWEQSQSSDLPGPAQGSAQSRSSESVGCNGFKELITLDFNFGLSLKKCLHRPELCAACPESRNRLKSLVHLGKEEEVSQISTDKSEILTHLNEFS